MPGLRQEYVRSPLLLNVFFAAILLVALERFSEDVDILVDLAHRHERSANAEPETALKHSGRVI